jgi:hypothetical protein
VPWLMPVILATWKGDIRRIQVGGHSRQVVPEAPSKITRAKRTGGVAQVVECLLCKHEAGLIKGILSHAMDG